MQQVLYWHTITLSVQLVLSYADKCIIENMSNAGELRNAQLLDHLIVTAEGLCSFSNEFSL
jgi:DNA repair protein RadC